MAYTIPPGNQVAFPFASATPYTPPAGNKVAFRFGGLPGTLFAAGFDASAFGAAEVANGTVQLFVAGWDAGVVSGNLVFTKSLLVAGIPPGQVGLPRLVNLTQEIRAVGREALATGTPWVSLSTRRLSAVTLGDQSRFGTLALAGGVRTVDVAGHSIAPPSLSRPVLSFKVREIFPAFIVATQWGRPLLDFQHDVSVPGFGGEAWGQPEVYRPRFIVDLQDLGIRGPLWGDNTAWLAKQYVAPPGWIAGGASAPEQFGHADVYNLKQVIAQLFEVTPSDGGVFGDFNSVANRNQQPKPEGFVMTRYGTPDVRNAARIVTTPPFIEFTAWGDNLVAPAIRTIEPIGADSSGWGSPLGTIVYNGARQLAPSGIPAGGMGKPNPVWSNLQSLRLVGADTSSFGEGMVDFAIRTVGPWSLPEPPPFGNAVVQLWERGLSVPGIGPGAFGGATLEQHFTIIAPKSVLPPANAFGDSRVRNLTPEVALFGWTATFYGRTAIHNQFETYRFESFGGETFGHQVVKDRRIFVTVDGVAPLPISQRHQVRNVDPDPPAPQTISPAALAPPAVPDPTFRTNVLAPFWSSPDVRFGTAKLVSNGIMPQGITPPYSPDTGVQCGVPSFNGAQFVGAQGIAAPSSANPVADVGPRYVWAPRGYPYDTGYWKEQGHQMDQVVFGTDHPERPVFGRPTFSLFHRAVAAQSPSAFLAFGTARFVQHPLYIRPNGTNLQRFGFPTLNGGGEVDFYGFDMSSWGATSVQHAEDLGPRTLKVIGIAAGTSPRQDVQLLNRTLQVAGFYTFTVSPPAAPAWPRTSTWVSRAYPPFPITGAEHAAYGTPWVSNYRRFVEPDGWISDVVALDSPGSFRDRMKVRKQLRIVGAGIGATGSVGVGAVSLWLNRIAPAGLAAGDVPRGAVRNVTRLNIDGWLDSAFGDLQRWEPGKVKPHGDDLAAFGRSVIHRAISPVGVAGSVGMPRLGSPLSAAGASHARAGVPTLTAMWCGNRAIAAHEGPAGATGIPTLEVVT